MSFGERPPNIEVGDEVIVSFVNSPLFILQGIVYHVASQTGECWRIKRKPGGALFYIQNFQSMQLLQTCEEVEEKEND